MNERENQSTKLRELTSKTLELLEAELVDLKANREGGKKMSQKAARTHRVRVLEVSRALPSLLKEARQLGKEDTQWAEGLSLDEKRQLIVEFFRILPQEHQRALVQELTRALNERRSA